MLTAAHCIEPGLAYKLYELDAERKPIFHDLAKTVVHPQFSKASLRRQSRHSRSRVAEISHAVAGEIPCRHAVCTTRPRVTVGEPFAIVGYGVTAPRDNRSAAVLRRADLIATGKPGNLQLRLFDPATKGETHGLGACTGDSGGPVYEERDGKRMVYGVISWTTGPKLSDGCGGLTGVTPLELYLPWIADTARNLGSPLMP